MSHNDCKLQSNQTTEFIINYNLIEVEPCHHMCNDDLQLERRQRESLLSAKKYICTV